MNTIPRDDIRPMLRFVVPGKVIAWQRAGDSARGHYTEAESRAYKRTVGFLMLSARSRDWPLDARYRLRVDFFGAHGSCDASNVLKQIEDAGKKLLWDDDRQIDDTRSVRGKGGESRVEVVVEVLA